MTQTALITGGAGFIGSHLTEALLADGWRVSVLDNFDPFYDENAKRRNIHSHLGNPAFRLIQEDIRNMPGLLASIPSAPDVIVHLAAKVGVRTSIKDPVGYQDVNVRGTQNVLELAKERYVPQIVFASSSSVYGLNPHVPWREEDAALLPISPYASTKVCGELMGHVYSHLYAMRFVALRLFTVFGPRQRPDLAIHKFARLMREGKPIPVFGDGSTKRDYTFVDDIVAGIRAAMEYRASSYEIINLGTDRTISLSAMIAVLAEVSGLQPRIDRRPEQPGDLPRTRADVSKAKALLQYRPKMDFRDGVRAFWQWFTDRNA